MAKKAKKAAKKKAAKRKPAKKKGSKVEDGAFTTACAQACSTGAITFGDVNNKESHVATLKTNDRAYHLLEEVGTQPSVFYQTKVRNRA